ncbi:MAG: LuxR C-terminal-related transcriptional regulator [Chloroflexia bacterium]
MLQLLAGGLPNKTIAARLGISEHTAKFHVSSVLAVGRQPHRSRGAGRTQGYPLL